MLMLYIERPISRSDASNIDKTTVANIAWMRSNFVGIKFCRFCEFWTRLRKSTKFTHAKKSVFWLYGKLNPRKKSEKRVWSGNFSILKNYV